VPLDVVSRGTIEVGVDDVGVVEVAKSPDVSVGQAAEAFQRRWHQPSVGEVE
jgi:hypothetical protein